MVLLPVNAPPSSASSFLLPSGASYVQLLRCRSLLRSIICKCSSSCFVIQCYPFTDLNFVD
ncbi:hypothetical protein Csa_006755 [Cucumis sativus]|uniref:Uncharacterized protein n=1 Tax=Cucumis sativus TaxID=3659 RepID=A0A0A0LI93_CUCSA|nr:hypothetical protein Csa_006755 [Cucumis sativus]